MNILHRTKYLLFSLFLALTANSCDKTPINGDLDGFWYITSLHTRPTPSAPYVNATPKNHVYWSFQLHLLSITGISNGYTSETLARFAHSGDSLRLTELYVHFRNRDEPVTQESTRTLHALSAIGISEPKVSFRVASLSDRNMTLVNSRDSITFHKIN